MVELNKHGEWQNDLEYITELQSELAEATKELAEAKAAIKQFGQRYDDADEVGGNDIVLWAKWVLLGSPQSCTACQDYDAIECIDGVPTDTCFVSP